VQVLAPMKRGAAGTLALNERLQQLLNPLPTSRDADDVAASGRRTDERAAAVMAGSTWHLHVEAQLAVERAAPRAALPLAAQPGMPRVGDAMIQLTNNYDAQVFNGDIGRVTAVAVSGKVLRFSVSYGGRSALVHGESRSDVLVEYTKSACAPSSDSTTPIGPLIGLHHIRPPTIGPHHRTPPSDPTIGPHHWTLTSDPLINCLFTRLHDGHGAHAARGAASGALSLHTPCALVSRCRSKARNTSCSTDHACRVCVHSLGKDVALSYALTVHKAQGAEYPVVVMPIVPQACPTARLDTWRDFLWRAWPWLNTWRGLAWRYVASA
jgi:hypothetical protein